MKLERIGPLRSRILKAKQAYYFGGTPLMSDAEYDALEDELRELSPNDEVLTMVGAPIPPDSILVKAKHGIPMGSQSKVNTPAEFASWYEKSAAGGAVHASIKGDGASAAAYFENGRLVQAISRGDGFEGEDITANAAKFKGLPMFAVDAQGRPFSGAVRFEAILTVEDWATVDPEKSKNPRNAGSGIMGRKNGAQSALLSCFAFDIDEQHGDERVRFDTESGKIARLRELGFQVISERLCDTAEEAIAYYEEITRTRDELPIWIDGVVFKVNDLERQRALGVTANRPKGQIAWKFDSKGAETTLLAYSLSIGHTGAIIPTAHLAPVEIGGTTVSNALLNNWDEIARLDVAVGDRVWLIKANDIIPKIVAVRERPPHRVAIPEPIACPACDSPIRRRLNTGGEAGAVLECSGDECPARAIGKLKRWIRTLDLQGIGDSVRLALVEQFGIEDVAALYTLRDDPARLASLVINPEKGLKLGEKRAQTILDGIEKTRHLTLVQLLGSLGIKSLGRRRVEMIISAAGEQLSTLDDWRSGKLRDPDFAAAVGVPGLGAAISDSFDAFLPVIDGLLKAGVVITGSGVLPLAETPSAGKVCISGKLPSGKKKADYQGPLEERGFELVDKVTKETSYLVLADPGSASAKAQKAAKLGVAVISEEQLAEIISAGKLDLGPSPG